MEMTPKLSPKFLQFLEDYAVSVGKDTGTVIEEAVSQAILRHQSAEPHPQHDAIIMPSAHHREVARGLGFLGRPTDTSFGEFMEQLPDRLWKYQTVRYGEWWLMIVALAPLDLAEPMEVRAIETSQAYAWLFGYAKQVKLWSAQDQFLLVF